MRRVLAKGDSQKCSQRRPPDEIVAMRASYVRVAMLFAIFTTASGLCTQPPITLTSLTRRASAISETWEQTALSSEFDSVYLQDGTERGWANWLIEGRLMLGQYPHCQPAVPGPTGSDAKDHLRRLLDTGIDCFACLQAEVPPQETTAGWVQFPVKDGFKEGVLLQDDDARSRFPAPFVRYYEDVYNIAMEVSGGQWLGPSYLHCPIEDLSLPGGGLDENAPLLKLLDEMLDHYETAGSGAIYLHCWGGRGRAGLVGACLLALMRPQLTPQQVLDAVQGGYDTRAGASKMGGALKRSPQTEPQRGFVKSFVNAAKAARRFDNDQAMAEGGMPTGFL